MPVEQRRRGTVRYSRLVPVSETPKKKLAEADDVFQACAALEEELAEVRAAYDQFFAGVERQPPAKRHAALKKKVLALKNQFVKHTAASFRIQNLTQKLATYERLWERSLKETESGTSRRDAFRLKRKSGQLPQPSAPVRPAPGHTLDEDLDLSDLDEAPPPPPAKAEAPKTPVASGSPPEASVFRAPAVRPSSPPPVKPLAAKAPIASDGGLSDKKVKAIYDAYVTAKKRCGEDVSKLSFETVAATLKKQVPTLLKQHNASAVEFKVVIKDGKAILRALPKE